MKCTFLRLLPAALLLSPALAQNTYVVDDDGGPGVDFTDIQPAVDVAGALDVIEVRHGNYGDVLIDHPVTVLGETLGAGPNDRARPDDVVVMGLAGSEAVVLADLLMDSLTGLDSAGMVLVDGGGVDDLDFERCEDVRLQNLDAAGFQSRPKGLRATDSRVQCVGTLLWPSGASLDNDGGPCVVATRSSVILTDCEVRGGAGGDQQLCFGGRIPDGGPALLLMESEVRILGGRIEGGEAGYDCFGFPAGLPGDAIEFDALSVVLESDASLNANQVTGAGSFVVEDGQPWFTLSGANSPGGAATFSFHAEAASSLRAFLGRRPVVTELPGFQVPLFHTAERGLSLGSAPPAGLLDLPWTIPVLPAGTLIHVQGSRTLPGGQSELSNALTLVVR